MRMKPVKGSRDEDFGREMMVLDLVTSAMYEVIRALYRLAGSLVARKDVRAVDGHCAAVAV